MKEFWLILECVGKPPALIPTIQHHVVEVAKVSDFYLKHFEDSLPAAYAAVVRKIVKGETDSDTKLFTREQRLESIRQLEFEPHRIEEKRAAFAKQLRKRQAMA